MLIFSTAIAIRSGGIFKNLAAMPLCADEIFLKPTV